MLCSACSEIFSKPREFGYGNFYPWQRTPASFKAAFESGCHLCSLIFEHCSYSSGKTTCSTDHFDDVRYAFRALNADWAQDGSGSKWLSLQHPGRGDWFGSNEYQQMIKGSPDITELSQMLTQRPENLLTEAVVCWLVLEFYGSEFHVALPVEIYKSERTIFHNIWQ